MTPIKAVSLAVLVLASLPTPASAEEPSTAAQGFTAALGQDLDDPADPSLESITRAMKGGGKGGGGGKSGGSSSGGHGQMTGGGQQRPSGGGQQQQGASQGQKSGMQGQSGGGQQQQGTSQGQKSGMQGQSGGGQQQQGASQGQKSGMQGQSGGGGQSSSGQQRQSQGQSSGGGSSGGGGYGIPGYIPVLPPAYVPPAYVPPAYAPPAYDLQIGFAYEVYRITGGAHQRINPARFTFRTGDQFHLRFMTNVPGIAEAFNISPEGIETRLGAWTVPAAQQVTLPDNGYFQFQGTAGQELFRLRVTPCAVDEFSRDRVIAVAGPAIGALLPDCRALDRTAAGARTITAVESAGGTSFGVLGISAAEYQSGQLSPRQLLIRMSHRY